MLLPGETGAEAWVHDADAERPYRTQLARRPPIRDGGVRAGHGACLVLLGGADAPRRPVTHDPRSTWSPRSRLAATPTAAPRDGRSRRVDRPRPVVPGQEATVEIPSLGVSLPVVRGGQDVIDRGVAAHYTGAQWRPPTDPGRPGTYWLAAHNSTHGSPFGSLSAIADGAEIRIIEPGRHRLHLRGHITRPGRDHDDLRDRLRPGHDHPAHPPADVRGRSPSGCWCTERSPR